MFLFFFFVLNVFTPLLLDDYSYLLKYNSTERIKNIFDIYEFQKIHYISWGGRVFAHSIAQIFLIMPKIIFNLVNSLMFVLEGFLIYKIALRDKENIMCLVITFLLLWFNPFFGEINLWLTGSCNYVWTMCVMLSYIYFFDNYKDNTIYKVILIVLAFFSGMCNENTSLAIIVLLLFNYIFIGERKENFKLASIFVCILGYLFLFFAPGNFVRSNAHLFSADAIIYNFNSFYIFLLFPFLIFSFALFYYIIKKKDIKLIGYYIAIVVCVFSLFIVQLTSFRGFYSAIVFTYIILLNIIKSFNLKILKVIIVLLLVVFTFQYIISFGDFVGFYHFYSEREDILVAAQRDGKQEVYLEIYYSDNSKIPVSFDLSDLNCSCDEFPNNVLERYYKVNKIIAKCE